MANRQITPITQNRQLPTEVAACTVLSDSDISEDRARLDSSYWQYQRIENDKDPCVWVRPNVRSATSAVQWAFRPLYTKIRDVYINSEVNHKRPYFMKRLLALSPIPHDSIHVNAILSWYYATPVYDWNLLYWAERLFILDDETSDTISQFLICIDTYLRQPVTFQSFSEIFLNAIERGPEYAKYLKDMRLFGIRKKMDAVGIADLVHLREYSASKPFAYGEYFNERFLPHWIESCDDFFEYSFIPLKGISETSEERFIRFGKELLSDLVYREDHSRLMSDVLITPVHSSSVWIEGGKIKFRGLGYEVRNRMPRDQANLFSKEFWGKRAVIQVGPANVRDTVVLDIRSRNTISLISRMLQPLVEQISESAMIADPIRRFSKVRNFLYYHYTFFMRDIKKEGLTKPRRLIYLTKVVLEQVYPNYDWSYLDIYEHVNIISGKKLYQPVRGTSLGMCNELTTIIQCIIFKIYQHTVLVDDDVKVNALFYNDDAIYGIRQAISREDLVDLTETERNLFDEYDLIRNEKKSFWADHCAIFLEEYMYFREMELKSILYKTQIAKARLCVNIAHAKEYISNCIYTNRCEKELEDIIQYWGYEFSDMDAVIPCSLGGWNPSTTKGLDPALKFIEKTDIHPLLLYRMYIASKENGVDYSRWGSTVDPNLPFKTAILEELPDLLVRSWYKRVKEVLSTREGFRVFWDDVYRMRRYKFYHGYKDIKFITMMRLVYLLIQEKRREFQIPDFLVEDYSTETIELKFHGGFRVIGDNPILSYIKYHEGIDLLFRGIHLLDNIKADKYLVNLVRINRNLSTFGTIRELEVSPKEKILHDLLGGQKIKHIFYILPKWHVILNDNPSIAYQEFFDREQYFPRLKKDLLYRISKQDYYADYDTLKIDQNDLLIMCFFQIDVRNYKRLFVDNIPGYNELDFSQKWNEVWDFFKEVLYPILPKPEPDSMESTGSDNDRFSSDRSETPASEDDGYVRITKCIRILSWNDFLKHKWCHSGDSRGTMYLYRHPPAEALFEEVQQYYYGISHFDKIASIRFDRVVEKIRSLPESVKEGFEDWLATLELNQESVLDREDEDGDLLMSFFGDNDHG